MSEGSASKRISLPPSQTEVLTLIVKLLDKAGHDPRLTIRILREKAESRLQLQRGALKPFRSKIKSTVVKWWQTKEEQTVHAAKMLVKLAKASGNQDCYSDLRGLPITEQISKLRERLAQKGLVFSAVVTDAEVIAAQKQTDLRKELDDIDQNAIISGDRKRKAAIAAMDSINATSSSSSDGADSRNNSQWGGAALSQNVAEAKAGSSNSGMNSGTSSDQAVVARKAAIIHDSDDEAEF